MCEAPAFRHGPRLLVSDIQARASGLLLGEVDYH